MGKASVYKSEGSIVKQGIRDNVKLSAMNRQGIQNISFNSSGSATKGLAPLNDKSKLSKSGGQIVGSLAFSHNLDFISSGTISSDSNSGNSTTSKSYLHLVPEGSTSSDTLNNLTGRKYEGQIMILTNGLAGSTITLTHTATGDGQFTCPNATDYDLVSPNAVMVIDDPTQTPYQTWKVIGNPSTTTVANNSITFAKIQDIATMKVIGRTATGSGDSSEITILDSDTMSGASATTLATSESIKAYVDASGGSTSFVGFTADDDLSMGTYNIDGVDQLIFSSATSSDSPTWTATDYGIEITGGTTPTGLNYNIPTGKFHYFNIGGTPELTIAPTLITLGAVLDLSNNGIQNVAHVYLNGAGTNDLLIDGNADGLDYKVPTGDFHRFYINSDERMKVHSTHVSIQNYIDIRSPTTTAPTNTAYTGIVGWFQIKVAGGDYRIPVWNAP